MRSAGLAAHIVVWARCDVRRPSGFARLSCIQCALVRDDLRHVVLGPDVVLDSRASHHCVHLPLDGTEAAGFALPSLSPIPGRQVPQSAGRGHMQLVRKECCRCFGLTKRSRQQPLSLLFPAVWQIRCPRASSRLSFQRLCLSFGVRRIKRYDHARSSQEERPPVSCCPRFLRSALHRCGPLDSFDFGPVGSGIHLCSGGSHRHYQRDCRLAAHRTLNIMSPNQITTTNAGWRIQIRFRGSRHWPGVAEKL